MKVKILIKAVSKSLIALLESKQYKPMGECFHPSWNEKYKGMVYSKPSSPMFWIFDFGQSPGDTVMIWIDTYGHAWKNRSNRGDGNVMVGFEMAPINKRTADAAIKSLILLLGQEHISVSSESEGYTPILRVSII